MTENQIGLAGQARGFITAATSGGKPTVEMFECQGRALLTLVDTTTADRDRLRTLALALALADRVYAQSELLSRRAERRAVALTESDYALEG